MASDVGVRSARGAWVVAIVVLGLVLIPAVAWLVLAGVRAASGELEVAMETMISAEQSLSLPPRWEVAGHLPVRVRMADPPLSQFLLVIGSKAPDLVLTVGVLWLIQRIAGSVRRGDPFNAANVWRLRWIGTLLIIGYPLAVIIDGFFTNWFFSNEHSPALPPESLVIGFPVVSAGALLGGLCMLVLAEVFRYGLRLREDVEGTV